jgi:hypothetical protein
MGTLLMSKVLVVDAVVVEVREISCRSARSASEADKRVSVVKELTRGPGEACRPWDGRGRVTALDGHLCRRCEEKLRANIRPASPATGMKLSLNY